MVVYDTRIRRVLVPRSPSVTAVGSFGGSQRNRWFLPLAWGWNQIQFPKHCVFYFWDVVKWTKTKYQRFSIEEKNALYRHLLTDKPISHEKCYSGNQRRRDHLGELDIIKGIILSWMPSSGTLLRVARSLLQLLVTANVPRSPIIVTLMMEEIHSSETSVLTRATRR
jgi:hypothetical protein